MIKITLLILLIFQNLQLCLYFTAIELIDIVGSRRKFTRTNLLSTGFCTVWGSRAEENICCSDGRMLFSALVIIFLFLKWWGQVPILRSIQNVTFKYGDFQKASRISPCEPSISINSIIMSNPPPCWMISMGLFISYLVGVYLVW